MSKIKVKTALASAGYSMANPTYKTVMDVYRKERDYKDMASAAKAAIDMIPCKSPTTPAAYCNKVCFSTPSSGRSIWTTVGNISTTSSLVVYDDIKQEQEKEDTMAIDLAARAQDHALGRLQTLRQKHYTAAYNHFKMFGPSKPATFAELKAMIENKEFEIRIPKDKDGKELADQEIPFYNNPFEYVVSTKNKPDTDGYYAAEKAIDAAYNAAKDELLIAAYNDGAAQLKILKDFEAKTFH